MAERYLIDPDLDFINEVVGLGGSDLKKCYQCATCSVVCPISPENKPFPRKEMIAASWGLKDKLVCNHDIWLCHNCGDCSTMCPRGAKPGDVLAAVRSYAISDYATPKSLGKMVNDPKKLPILFGIPVILFAFFAILTTFAGDLFARIFGGEFWYHTHNGLPLEGIAHSKFISTWFVDLVFVPLSIWVVVIFAMGLKRFLNDIHKNALLEGKTEKKELDLKAFLKSIVNVLPTILRHDKFNECSENKERSTAHMMVLFGFIGLFIVTGIFFLVLYIFHIPGPYSQLNPVKWLANVSGLALIIGGILMIKSRLSKTDQVTGYKDWYLIGLVLGLGVTGMLTEMSRLAEVEYFSYFIYLLHLAFVFCLFAYLPFSKLAHLVYRTVAMAYDNYGNRR
ncbi:MAG: heterodisulfide reductase [Deltaproteobacteria bacterium]|nr:MAG: heterodisulfide reductase [Deltaproteobacteria bacterium]